MKSIIRISQIDLVIDQLKEYFLSDLILEGEKLPNEKRLCEMLNVGRSTIREAIKVLQVMGYVKIYPGRGAFLVHKKLNNVEISTLQWLSENKPRVQDIVEIRVPMEKLSVKLAIERGSQESIDRIDQCRIAYEQALELKRYQELAKLDAEFHQAIFEATGNDLLIALSKIIMLSFADFRMYSFSIRGHAANAVIPHREISQAILDHDVELAQLQMVRHLNKILEDINYSLSLV